jgi:hypothetical protein
VPADQVLKVRLYVVAPPSGPEREDFTLTLRALDKSGETDQDHNSFVRPETVQ